MEIRPLQIEHLPQAAALFVAGLRRARQALPLIPADLENVTRVTELLQRLLTRATCLAAFQQGQLVGYLGGYLFDRFRDAERKTAWCPEWGHATSEEGRTSIYRALYREASTLWKEAGCQAHCLTILAYDAEAVQAWFWNGFGLLVVDAVRSLLPLEGASHCDLVIRQAGPEDAEAVAELDLEHCRHYSAPPVFMAPRRSDDPAAVRRFLSEEGNSIWLALEQDRAIGFLRCASPSDEAADVMLSAGNAFINGAYVRPQYRGQGVSTAMLDAVLRTYNRRGYQRAVLDFESFNPEAASFWLRTFQPACYSLMRVPES